MRSNHGPQIDRVQRTYGRPLRAVLLELYYRRRLSHREIGELLEVPMGTVHGWFTRLGITPDQLATTVATAELAVEDAATVHEEIAS